MFRSVVMGLAIAVWCASPASGQEGATSVEGYFTGKMVVVKIDMPGTEKGVDLDFEKPVPLDWNSYSSRLNEFGIAIHKGDSARVTKIALKGDHIEFQLDGGGYGTFGESTSTKVSAKDVDKSRYEKDLEKQLKQAKDPKAKEDLQTELDKEVEKREKQEQEAREQAAAATQAKVKELADKRARGGSRFNLNFKKSVPSDDRNPDAVMKLLAEYVDFGLMNANGTPAAAVSAPVESPSAAGGDASGLAQLKRGMNVDNVASLLGQGQQVSQTVSSDGLKTQVIEFKTAESVADVTFVEGVVVRYTISSR